MHNVKFVYYLFIYMKKIHFYAIDFAGKLIRIAFSSLPMITKGSECNEKRVVLCLLESEEYNNIKIFPNK